MNLIKLQNRIDTIFMNSENSKISEPYSLLLDLSDKINLKSSDKYVALSNLSTYYTWKNIKRSFKSKEFKISDPMWKRKFELPNGSFSVSDIQDYFEYIIKKHETLTDNLSIRIYVYKVEIGVHLKLKEAIISRTFNS